MCVCVCVCVFMHVYWLLLKVLARHNKTSPEVWPLCTFQPRLVLPRSDICCHSCYPELRFPASDMLRIFSNRGRITWVGLTLFCFSSLTRTSLQTSLIIEILHILCTMERFSPVNSFLWYSFNFRNLFFLFFLVEIQLSYDITLLSGVQHRGIFPFLRNWPALNNKALYFVTSHIPE